MTIYLTPLNDFAIDFPLEKFDAASGNDVPVTSGNVRAFIATSRSSLAVAVHSTLDAIAAAYSAVTKMWSVEIDAATLTPTLLKPLFGPPPADGVFFSDTFTRADSATALGWGGGPATTFTTWGIDANRAYCVADDGFFGAAFRDADTPNVIIRVKIPVLSSGGGIAFRLEPETVPTSSSDASYYAAYIVPDGFYLVYVDTVPGSTNIVAEIERSYTPDPTHWLVVSCRGSEIVARIMSASATEAQILDHTLDAGADEIARLEWFDTHESAQATHHGLFAYNAGGARFDNFSIAAAAPPTPVLIITLPNGIRRTLPLEFRDSEDVLVEV
jgi:hypothetical protein